MIGYLKNRKKAIKFVKELVEDSHKVLVIHYSCESLTDKNEGYSPRITSIVVRTLRGDMQPSFSIHLVAERMKITQSEIEKHYDRIELEMLDSFYEFVGKNEDRFWLNWNMRNVNYGFEAIEHRYRVLGGNNFRQISYENRVNIRALIQQIYGEKFEPHPKMINLIKSNFEDLHHDFLRGDEECTAFEEKKFLKLHKSTTVKTDYFAKIVFKISNGKLKVSQKSTTSKFATYLSHPIFILLGIVASIVTIILGVIYFSSPT